MRVEYPKLPEHPPERLALYLRGTAFDRYDGTSWSRTITERVKADRLGTNVRIRRFGNPGHDRMMTIDLEPIDPPVLFLPSHAVAIKLLPRGTPLLGRLPTIYKGPEGEYKYASTEERGIRYDVFLDGTGHRKPTPLSANDRMRYLEVPAKMPQRIAELARHWVGSTTNPVRQAELIEHHLRHDYKYDLDSPSGAAAHPLDDFLFNSKRGHCEFYSTAMAIMLRTLGVPTRNVTGFIGGTYNRFGHYYAVRQGDAHSWVEVYFDKKGWTRFDPTPPSDAAPQSDVTGLLAFVRDFIEATAQRWNRHVVGYDLKQQVQLFHSVRSRYSMLHGPGGVIRTLASPRRLVALFLGLVLVIGGVMWLRRQRRGKPHATRRGTPTEVATLQVVKLYRSLEDAMAVHGVIRPASTPPLSHAKALVEMGHPIGPEVLSLTERYVEARFGGQPMDDAARRDFSRRVKLLRQATRERPQGRQAA